MQLEVDISPVIANFFSWRAVQRYQRCWNKPCVNFKGKREFEGHRCDDFRVSGEFCSPRIYGRVGPRAIDYEPRHTAFHRRATSLKEGGGDYFRRRSLFGRPDVIKTACPSLSLAPPRSRISFKGQFPRRPRNNIFSPTIIISCRLTMVSTNFRNSGEFSRRGKTSFLVAASVYIPAPIAAVHRHRRAIAIPILCQTPFFLIWYSRQCHVNP